MRSSADPPKPAKEETPKESVTPKESSKSLRNSIELAKAQIQPTEPAQTSPDMTSSPPDKTRDKKKRFSRDGVRSKYHTTIIPKSSKFSSHDTRDILDYEPRIIDTVQPLKDAESVVSPESTPKSQSKKTGLGDQPKATVSKSKGSVSDRY